MGLGDRPGQQFISRAAAPGILGERPVVLRDAEPEIMTMHPHEPDPTR